MKLLYNRRFRFAYCLLILSGFWLIVTTTPAQSAMISFYLDQNNAGLPPANYAKVTISDSGTVAGNIDFLVEVLTDAFPVQGPNFGMQNFYFNYDSSFEVTETNIANLDPDTWGITKDQNAGGGFGKFEFELSGSGSTRVATLSFSIAGVDGDDPWTYALGDSEFFAAHIADFSGLVDDIDSAKFAGSTLVPIPGAWLLLGSGFFCLFAFRRRSNK